MKVDLRFRTAAVGRPVACTLLLRNLGDRSRPEGVEMKRAWKLKLLTVVLVAGCGELRDGTSKASAHRVSDVAPLALDALADADFDGIDDAFDRCRATPTGARVWNSGDFTGCTTGQYRDSDRPWLQPQLQTAAHVDADGDGIADDADRCESTPRGTQVWIDGEWAGCAEGQRLD